ncbi:hypothetical protein [Streptomyces sp. Isolate_219]|uniref:hypothetical protein n=1 Tax=Streptomyces sp. Isolate_219 TaxID=2950110 RepID=UPI0021CAB87B|nr:hypothetical protein [Streptomyces sp. Isolate_219]MCR8575491.1 hypothetical protein [Streptomyces sp. Isolate_219]
MAPLLALSVFDVLGVVVGVVFGVVFGVLAGARHVRVVIRAVCTCRSRSRTRR